MLCSTTCAIEGLKDEWPPSAAICPQNASRLKLNIFSTFIFGKFKVKLLKIIFQK